LERITIETTKRKLDMPEYRVVTGPTATLGGKCCGANANIGGAPFEKIINAQVKDGYRYVEVFSHTIKGACCCIFPSDVNVNLLVFVKD
jgi:hypothetical protein|tara:strand:- start:819 stop:1085 length:267 start_codon:yes stop_codon:yes gene_type:complete